MQESFKVFDELRSEEVQELLTQPPRWLLRWGIMVVFCVLVLLLIGMWFVHFPDIVRASFRLTSANAPLAVLTRTDGKLVQLLASEGQVVKMGQPLAYLESTARHKEVIQLSEELRKAWIVTSRGNLEGLNKLNFVGYGQLGELQISYQTFEQARIHLNAYLAGGFASKKKSMLQQEVVDLQALSQNLREQHSIQAQDIQLAEEDYGIQLKLYHEKVISRLDIKREESKTLAKRLPYQQTASSIISNLTSQRAKQKELLELDQQIAEERDKFLQALNTMQSSTDAWKARYVLTAPVAGNVVFPGALQENQSVALNEEVFYVVPPSTEYYGELRIPQLNVGKVIEGQDVLVKFVGFPYQEFGVVRGRIVKIADISLKDSLFLAKVILPKGLKTTHGKSLTYKTGMIASAEIITEDNRLIEKLFFQLRKLVNAR